MGKITADKWISFLACTAKRVLSDKRAGIFIVLLVLMARVLQLLYFFNTRNDMTYQILGAQHFFEGHGISAARISSNDLSTVIYEPQIKWPPGFSLLFVPFYALFGKSYLPAAIALSLLSALVLVLVCRNCLKVLGIPLYLVNLYTLITGFSIYYFYNKPCTDANAITFYMIAFYFTLLLLKTRTHFLRNTFCSTGALFICASIKYLYFPVVFTIPAFLLMKGFSNKDQRLKKAGFFSFTSLMLGLGGMLVYQKLASNAVGYIRQTARGFFPENLLAAHPFLPASFIKPESLELLASISSDISSPMFRCFQIIHFVLFLGLLVYALKSLMRTSFRKSTSARDYFYLALMASFIITALLAVLSLRVAPETEDGIVWTYLQEPRYYGLINVLLHLGVFVLYQSYAVSKSRFLKYLFCFLLLALLPEAFRGLIFTSGRALQLSKEEYGWMQEHRFQQYTQQVLDKEKASHQEATVVLTGSSDWMTLRASLYTGLPVFEDVNTLNTLSILNTQKPVLVLAILRDSDLERFNPYLSSKDCHFAGSNYGFSFYTSYLVPH